MIKENLQIKVCGLFDRENLREILTLNPDFIGLNFYSNSKRFCKFSELPDFDFGKTKIAGVFVDSEIDFVEKHVAKFNLSCLQLHGREDSNYLYSLRERLPDCKIIKVFGIEEAIDLEGLKDWQTFADYYLFDKKSIAFGGSGKKFDWDLLHQALIPKPFFLAGGIGPEDLRPIKLLNKIIPELFAIDINSCFEDRAGLKQVDLVRNFVEGLRL